MLIGAMNILSLSNVILALCNACFACFMHNYMSSLYPIVMATNGIKNEVMIMMICLLEIKTADLACIHET